MYRWSKCEQVGWGVARVRPRLLLGLRVHRIMWGGPNRTKGGVWVAFKLV